MNPITIEIDWVYFLGIVGSLLGIAWYTNGRFTKIETTLTFLKDSVTKFEGKILDQAFGHGSPIKLLERGVEVLNDSGFKKYVDSKKEQIMAECKSNKNFTNQYDIQESVFECFDKMDFGEFTENLKASAFKYGMSVETVRRIGAIYFRDIVLREHGFTPDDLDKPKG